MLSAEFQKASFNEESAKLDQEALRATRAHLDSSYDLLLKVVQAKAGVEQSTCKVQWALGKVRKRILSLAIGDGEEDEKRQRKRG